MMLRVFALPLLLMATAAHAIEGPRYQVLQSDGAFELRQCRPTLTAHVEVHGDARSARKVGFRLSASDTLAATRGSARSATWASSRPAMS